MDEPENCKDEVGESERVEKLILIALADVVKMPQKTGGLYQLNSEFAAHYQETMQQSGETHAEPCVQAIKAFKEQSK